MTTFFIISTTISQRSAVSLFWTFYICLGTAAAIKTIFIWYLTSSLLSRKKGKKSNVYSVLRPYSMFIVGNLWVILNLTDNSVHAWNFSIDVISVLGLDLGLHREVNMKTHEFTQSRQCVCSSLFIMSCNGWVYCAGCSLNIVFFQRISESLPPLPRQHSAAIGCKKKIASQ